MGPFLIEIGNGLPHCGEWGHGLEVEKNEARKMLEKRQDPTCQLQALLVHHWLGAQPNNWLMPFRFRLAALIPLSIIGVKLLLVCGVFLRHTVPLIQDSAKMLECCV